MVEKFRHASAGHVYCARELASAPPVHTQGASHSRPASGHPVDDAGVNHGPPQFGLTSATALIIGTIVGVGIFNLPTSL